MATDRTPLRDGILPGRRVVAVFIAAADLGHRVPRPRRVHRRAPRPPWWSTSSVTSHSQVVDVGLVRVVLGGRVRLGNRGRDVVTGLGVEPEPEAASVRDAASVHVRCPQAFSRA